MTATIKIESADFANALRRLDKKMKGDMEGFIISQGGLLITDIVKNSYPKKRIHGVKAVRRDMSRAVKPMRTRKVAGAPPTFDGISDERLKKRLNMLLRAKNYTAIEEILKTWTSPWNKTQVVPFNPRLHKRVRNKRGHVRRWTGKATPDIDDWRDYRKKIEDRVGLYKHGWVGAGRKLTMWGAKGVNIPKWVSKPRDKPTGTATKEGTGYKLMITLVNPYSYAHGSSGSLKFAVGLRAKKMRKSVDRIVSGAAEQSGFTAR